MSIGIATNLFMNIIYIFLLLSDLLSVPPGFKQGVSFNEVNEREQQGKTLSLNGHLCKTDTSAKRTLRIELVPAFLYSLYLTLYKTDTSVKKTPRIGPLADNTLLDLHNSS